MFGKKKSLKFLRLCKLIDCGSPAVSIVIDSVLSCKTNR